MKTSWYQSDKHRWQLNSIEVVDIDYIKYHIALTGIALTGMYRNIEYSKSIKDHIFRQDN